MRYVTYARAESGAISRTHSRIVMHEDDDRSTLIREDRAQRIYRGRLFTAPDCRDPDHPGCWRCEPDDYPEPWADEPLPPLYQDPLP